MRLALVVEQLLGPVPGGTGRYAREIAAALGARDDVQPVTWVAWHRDTSSAAVPGVAGPRRLALPRRPLALAWERGRGPAPTGDVVHAPTLLSPPRRRPLVVTIHDVVPWTHPEVLTRRGVHWHRAMAERVARTADRVVVPSHAVADQLVRYVALSRPPVVVPLGRTALPVPTDPDGVAARLGLPPGGFVLSLSTVEPRKGLDVLFAAMARPEAPHLPVVVVGAPGWGGVSVRGLAAAAGLPHGQVIELGHIPDDDLAVVLAHATVLAAPSRAEGFGLPVLEGMAAGVPVVTSDDPALRELGGDATVVAPVGDVPATAHALSAATSGPMRTRGRTEGPRRAAAYSWTATAERLVEVYREVV